MTSPSMVRDWRRIDESTGGDPQYDQARPTCDAQVAAAFASFRPGSGATR